MQPDPGLARLRKVTADRVELARTMPVGPVLVAELFRLRGEPLDGETAVEMHALWGKVIAWASAEQMIATDTAIHGIRGTLEPDAIGEAQMLAAQEIACASRVGYATAMCQVTLVENVAAAMPASWEALDRGDITLAHLKAVEKVTRNCSARVTQAVDEQVIALAVQRGWTPGETARAARKLVIALDPEGAEDRAKAAKDDADVRLYPGDDETSTLYANGDAVRNRQVMDAINDYAEQLGRAGDSRNVGVRRFDALYDLVCGASDSALAPVNPDGTVATRHAARATTLLGLDLATLLGLNEYPGELIGYGPITAATARKLAADSMLRRLVTDPITGEALDLGRNAYKPSAALRRLIEAAHPTCTMPGCCHPSIHCEIDHRFEWHDGGHTDRCNLKPLCKMHHQMKTKGRWRVDQNPDGSETWTSYLGHTYTKWPHQFDLPEPLPDEDPPEDIADRLSVGLFDAYPSNDQIPLPEPPRSSKRTTRK